MTQLFSEHAFRANLTQMQAPWMAMTNSSMKPVVDAMNFWNSTLFSAASALNARCLSFLERRGRAEIQLGQEIASCKSPAEAWPLLLNFWSTAADDYRNQLQKVVNHWTDVADAGLTSLSSCTNERALTEPRRLAA